MLVMELMTTPVSTISPTATVRQAIRLLSERNITAMPVVDERGHLAGIVSEMDLLRREFPTDPRASVRYVPDTDQAPPHLVAEVMTRKVTTVRGNTDVAELADIMISTSFKSIPVVDGDRLVGIVSRRDLIGVLAHSDARIRDDVHAAIASLCPDGGEWTIDVRDGRVTLRGHRDTLTEQLVDTVARTVPGVSHVTLLDASPQHR